MAASALLRRLAASLVLLLVLVLLAAAVPQGFASAVGLTLVGALAIQWGAALYFNRKSAERPDIVSLRVRAQDQVALAVASTAAAVLGGITVARELALIGPVTREVSLIGLSFALLMLVAPAVNALVTFAPWREGATAVKEGARALFRRRGGR
jgi:hypothetical protein